MISQYKNVSTHTYADVSTVYWQARVTRKGKILINKNYRDERVAALAVDKALISAGYDPVNILKKVP